MTKQMTKRKDIKTIVREEIQRTVAKLVKEAHARPVGSAELFANSGLVIMQDGRFNVDVLVNRVPEAITGRLDQDSLDVLIELGAIKPISADPVASEDEEFPAFDEVNETDTPGS